MDGQEAGLRPRPGRQSAGEAASERPHLCRQPAFRYGLGFTDADSSFSFQSGPALRPRAPEGAAQTLHPLSAVTLSGQKIELTSFLYKSI